MLLNYIEQSSSKQACDRIGQHMASTVSDVASDLLGGKIPETKYQSVLHDAWNNGCDKIQRFVPRYDSVKRLHLPFIPHSTTPKTCFYYSNGTISLNRRQIVAEPEANMI